MTFVLLLIPLSILIVLYGFVIRALRISMHRSYSDLTRCKCILAVSRFYLVQFWYKIYCIFYNIFLKLILYWILKFSNLKIKIIGMQKFKLNARFKIQKKVNMTKNTNIIIE